MSQSHNRHLLPLGLKIPEIRKALADVARAVPMKPKEVWCIGATGTLACSLQDAWPDAQHNVVRICKEESADFGRAKIYDAQEQFSQKAKLPPPYPSVPEYDAKLWRYVKQHASPGALVWNVAG